jgi:hypothetical protein
MTKINVLESTRITLLKSDTCSKKMVVGISRHYRIDIDALLLPLQQSFLAAYASHDLRFPGAGRTYFSTVASTKQVSRRRPSSSRNMHQSFG